jgi:hypothetical protein
LTFNRNSDETEDMAVDKDSENNVETNDNKVAEDTMDLSVKKSVDPKPEPTETTTTEEPMEVTLDLSMPSSSVDSSERPNGQNQQLASDWSQNTSPDSRKPDTEENSSQLTNGNHINGFIASDDSASVIADEEVALPPSPKLNELSGEELRARQRKMRRLKQELRNEEMKLVLLKKLRQSQIMKENIVTNLTQPVNPSVPVNHSNHTNHTNHSNHTMAKIMTNNVSSRNGSIGAPLTAPNPTLSHQNHHRERDRDRDRERERERAHSKGHSVLNPPYSRNQGLSHGPLCPPPLGLGQRNSSSNHMPSAAHSHSQSLRPGPLSSLNRTPVTTPPNVVLGYPVQDLRNQQNSNSLLSSHQSVRLFNSSYVGF